MNCCKIIENEEIVKQANALVTKMKKDFGTFVSYYLVSKGTIPEIYENRIPTMFDVKCEVEQKFGMSNAHVLVIRPDGYVAFHQNTLNIEKILRKMGYWLKSNALC